MTGGMALPVGGDKTGMVVLQQDPANWTVQHLAFSVGEDDLERAMVALKEHGVPVRGPVHHEWMQATSVYFLDPDGHDLELCAPVVVTKGAPSMTETLPPDRLEQLWAEHLKGEFETKDVEATLATMVEDAYVNHMPVNTGGRGKAALRRFYRDDFIPSWPDDLQTTPVNRVVGAGQLVDECTPRSLIAGLCRGSCQMFPRRTRRSRWTSWWSSSFGVTSSPLSGSTGTTPPCCGKSGC